MTEKKASEQAILEAENVRKLKEEQDDKREDLKVIHQSYKELQAVNEAIKKAYVIKKNLIKKDHILIKH